MNVDWDDDEWEDDGKVYCAGCPDLFEPCELEYCDYYNDHFCKDCTRENSRLIAQDIRAKKSCPEARANE